MKLQAAIRKALTKEDREGVRQVTEFLTCAMTAQMMSERFKEDFPGNAEMAAMADMISDDPAGAVALLEAMVEGDEVLHDGPTHAFFRKLLDDHRELW